MGSDKRAIRESNSRVRLFLPLWENWKQRANNAEVDDSSPNKKRAAMPLGLSSVYRETSVSVFFVLFITVVMWLSLWLIIIILNYFNHRSICPYVFDHHLVFKMSANSEYCHNFPKPSVTTSSCLFCPKIFTL